MSDDIGARLSRWSQRKHAARHGGARPEPADVAAKDIRPDDNAKAAETPAAEKAPDVTPATAEEMPVLPPIDELTFQSDYTGFLHKNVPETLHRAALRKLWVSDPVLANLDGLNDYDEDYNVVDRLITAAQTAYKPGKGYFDDVEEAVARLESDVAKVDSKNAGEVEAKSSAESPGERTVDEDDVTHNAPDEAELDGSRQLAAAVPEAGALADDSGLTDRTAPPDVDSGPRRRT